MLYYAIGLLLVFFVCLVGEFFLPSAGTIGIVAALSGIGAILCGFSYSLPLGYFMLSTVVISTPVVLMFMVKVWPHTPIGRRILNRRPGQVDEAAPPRVTRQGTPLNDLVGQMGVAETDLLPNGRVIMDGQKLDAVSLGAAIDAGSNVVVVRISSGKIQVRKAQPSETAAVNGTKDFDVGQSAEAADVNLGEEPKPEGGSSLESFDLDSLE